MTTDLQTAAGQLLTADDYCDVFGGTPSPSKPGFDPGRHIRSIYRRLATRVYPDLYSNAADKMLATEAFMRLQKLRDEAEQAVRDGRFGEPLLLATIQTRKAKHDISRTLGSGDICVTFGTATYLPDRRAGFCKIAKAPADSDLVQAEARALKKLRGTDADPKRHMFMPELLDSFVYHETGKPRLHANVVALLEGFYTLDQVRQAYPGGIDPLHVVWIWRRLLVAIAHAHDNNVVHGAVLPRHVLIHPAMHGLVLTDWCYSSIRTDGAYPAIKAVVADCRDWYPSEVLRKQAPGPQTDIVMAAGCVVYLLGGDPATGNLPVRIPRQFRAFLRGCMQAIPAQRPDNAWSLLGEFDELLESMGSPYYPRRFRPFHMPAMPTGTAQE